MTEIKIIVEATELTTAINALAAAISGVNPIQGQTAVASTSKRKSSKAAQTAAEPVPEQTVATPPAPEQIPAPAATINPAPAAMPTGAPISQAQTGMMPTAAPAPAAQYQQIPTGAVPTQPQSAVPAYPGVRTYTTEEIARAGSVLLSQGAQVQLNGLLQQFGVASINQLRPEQLAPFADGLRAMGAPI